MSPVGHEMLGYTIRWRDVVPLGTAAVATRGRLSVRVGADEVWELGEDTWENDWPWVELLEHLAVIWPYLVHERGYDPLGLGVDPDALRPAAAVRWRSKSRSVAESEENELLGYLRTHDLAAGLRGASAPNIFIVRRGDQARIVGGGVRCFAPWQGVEETLARLGGEIASRLVGLTDPRAVEALAAWRDRDSLDEDKKLSIETNWPMARIVPIRTVLSMTGRLIAERRETFLFAARMLATRTDPEVMEVLLGKLLENLSPVAEALLISSWRRAASRTLTTLTGLPHEQGRTLGRWFRGFLGVDPTRRIDPESLLVVAGVTVIPVDPPSGSGSVDALCAWPDDFRPCVVLNTKGPHAKGFRGSNATLAHELCHLLVDLGDTLPYAEAKAPRAPAPIEARANAFAAELLLPSQTAGIEMTDVTAAGVAVSVRQLCNRFGASQAIVAWQALNAGVRFQRGVRAKLTELAKEIVASEETAGSIPVGASQQMLSVEDEVLRHPR